MNGVYCLTNKINGKRYVGIGVSSKNSNGIEARWNAYKRLDCEDQPKLYNALKKYGPENFIYEVILETNDRANALRSEMYLVDIWDTLNQGYNGTYGGETTGHMAREYDEDGINHPRTKVRSIYNTITGEILTGCVSKITKKLKICGANLLKRGYAGEWTLIDEDGKINIENHSKYKIHKAINTKTKEVVSGTRQELTIKTGIKEVNNLIKRGYSKNWSIVLDDGSYYNKKVREMKPIKVIKNLKTGEVRNIHRDDLPNEIGITFKGLKKRKGKFFHKLAEWTLINEVEQ